MTVAIPIWVIIVLTLPALTILIWLVVMIALSAVVMPIWATRLLVKWAARHTPAPELDSEKIGLTLVGVTYGVVLAQVFAPTFSNYRYIRGPGWSQLGLAAAALVLSYIGFYNNRATYPLWKTRFVNIPLLQYGISISLAGAYFALIATAELPGGKGLVTTTGGLPKGTGVTLAETTKLTSAKPEAFWIFLIFGAYLVWDALEVTLLLSPRYQQGLAEERLNSMKKLQQFLRTDVYRFEEPGTLAVRAVVHLFWTLVFFLAGGIACLYIQSANTTDNVTVVIIDCSYIAGLFIYRVAQEWST